MATYSERTEHTGPEDGDARYRALLQANPDALVAVDLQGKITETNIAMQRLTDLSGAEMLGMKVEKLFEDPAKALAGLETVLSEGGVTDFPLNVRGSGGRSTPVYFNAAILPGPDGEPGGALGVARDLSKFVRVERELEETYARMRAHLENSPAAVMEWDHESCVLSWSAGAERLFGWSADEAVGKIIGKDLKIVHEEDAEDVGKVMEALLGGGEQRVAFENRNCRKDGTVVHCQWINSVLREERGRVTSVMSIALDITRQKHLETELRHLADHDSLTGLPNRRAFEAQLEAALARLRRYPSGTGGTLAMLYFDLDSFKLINDMHGHAVGDEVLRQVAQRLSACLREVDTPARLGGDEFAAILQPTGDAAGSREAAQTAAERVRRAMEEPFFVDGLPLDAGLRVGLSLGFANGTGKESAKDLLRRADERMYRSKTASRAARTESADSPR